MSPLRKLLVDVHTHVYLPRYASVLRSRSIAPRVFTRNTPSGQNEERLLILDDEPSGGRPVGGQVRHSPNYDIVSNDAVDSTGTEMRRSNSWTGTGSISPSSGTPHLLSSSSQLVDRQRSSANPWLDFLPFSEARTLAQQLNADLETYCATGPALASDAEFKRLYGFGLLPLVPGAPAESLPEAVSQLAAQHPHIRGVIVGTRGAGLGLDDPMLEPVWAALAETGLVVFLHPHYGVGAQAWGTRDNGHVLPLALGFPFETTTVYFVLPRSRWLISNTYVLHRLSRA